jgi:membrane protein DedA with SNARE-associated domain
MGHLSSVWAYITLGAVSFITEEFAPISGGIAAHDVHLMLSWVAMSCALGTWVSDIGLYYLGRWRGAWVRNRWPRIARAFTRTLMGVRRAPWRSSLAVRYAYGLRITLPVACGAAHVPVAEYLAGSAISALTWASLFTVLGWAFGRSAELVMRHIRRYEDVVGLAVAGLLGVLVLLYVRRTEEPAGDPPAREFERQLDILSGEYPVLREEGERGESDRPSGRPSDRPSYGDSGAVGGDPGDEMEPPEQGRRRA